MKYLVEPPPAAALLQPYSSVLYFARTPKHLASISCLRGCVRVNVCVPHLFVCSQFIFGNSLHPGRLSEESHSSFPTRNLSQRRKTKIRCLMVCIDAVFHSCDIPRIHRNTRTPFMVGARPRGAHRWQGGTDAWFLGSGRSSSSYDPPTYWQKTKR